MSGQPFFARQDIISEHAPFPSKLLDMTVEDDDAIFRHHIQDVLHCLRLGSHKLASRRAFLVVLSDLACKENTLGRIITSKFS